MNNKKRKKSTSTDIKKKKKKINEIKIKNFKMINYNIGENDKICFLADSIYFDNLELKENIKKPILRYKLSDVIEQENDNSFNSENENENEDEDEDENIFSPIFSEELGNEKNSYYGYFKMKYSDFINYFYENKNDCYYHEMIMNDTQIKFFFDFDLDISKNDQFDFFQKVGETIEFFCEFMSKNFKISISFDDFIFLDCTRIDKYSMHVVLTEKVYLNNISTLKMLIDEFILFSFRKEKVPILSKCIMDEFTKIVWMYKNIIDTTVYKKNRTLRIFGSKKIGLKEVFVEKKIKKKNGYFFVVKTKKVKSKNCFARVMEKSLLHFIKSSNHKIIIYENEIEGKKEEKIDISKLLFDYHIRVGLKNEDIMKFYTKEKNLIVNLENHFGLKPFSVKKKTENKSNENISIQTEYFYVSKFNSSVENEIIKMFSDIYNDYLKIKYNIKEENNFKKIKFNGKLILIDFQGVCSKIYESEKRYHKNGKPKSGLCLIYDVQTGIWFQDCKTEACKKIKSSKIVVSEDTFKMVKKIMEIK